MLRVDGPKGVVPSTKLCTTPAAGPLQPAAVACLRLLELSSTRVCNLRGKRSIRRASHDLKLGLDSCMLTSKSNIRSRSRCGDLIILRSDSHGTLVSTRLPTYLLAISDPPVKLHLDRVHTRGSARHDHLAPPERSCFLVTVASGSRQRHPLFLVHQSISPCPSVHPFILSSPRSLGEMGWPVKWANAIPTTCCSRDVSLYQCNLISGALFVYSSCSRT